MAHLCCRQTFSHLSRRKGLPCLVWLAISLLFNRLRNILPKTAPLVVILVAPSTSMAVVSKDSTPLPRKSDKSWVEVGERRQSHTLRFEKCL